ncbi:MAG: hypothetical protein HYW70_00760 [Candidatus Nealsonbacteria bacterium]|nr:hypothetical protein [Candidatus Nealsonbacteria bacterium]
MPIVKNRTENGYPAELDVLCSKRFSDGKRSSTKRGKAKTARAENRIPKRNVILTAFLECFLFDKAHLVQSYQGKAKSQFQCALTAQLKIVLLHSPL